MEFFKRITTSTEDQDKQNAVIMGRKTWFSIPEKFRPLKGRVNIVLSRELKEVPEGVYIARSLPEALSLVETAKLCDTVENVHVIGGSSVYQEAMSGPYPCRLYLTRVLKDFECDTFLPDINDDKFRKIANPENVPVELQQEGDVKFRFEVYEKETGHKTSEPDHVHSKPLRRRPIESLDTLHPSSNGSIKFDIMAAMCHGNRGIGYKMRLPWPSLKKDFEYYRGHVSTLRDTKSDGKKVIHIRGRHTWTCCRETERSAPDVYHVIVSSTWTDRDCEHPRMLKVVPTFGDAMAFTNDLYQHNGVDSVWVMGGSSIYQEALLHPQCNCLYLTHVYADFPADAFFPEFEGKFQEIDDHPEKDIQHEDNGVKFEFKVYERISES